MLEVKEEESLTALVLEAEVLNFRPRTYLATNQVFFLL